MIIRQKLKIVVKYNSDHFILAEKNSLSSLKMEYSKVIKRS